MAQRNPNSFDLSGDGDDVDVIEEAERVFGVRIADHEAERMRTFGDLLDCVEAKMDLSGSRTCLLRRAFVDLRGEAPHPAGRRLRPSLPLDVLGEEGVALRRRVDPWARRAAERPWATRLELAGCVALPAVSFLGMSWAAGGFLGLSIVGMLGLGMALSYRKLRPAGPATVGDLLRSNFDHLYPDLSRRHGPGLPCDRWRALEALCLRISGHEGPVTRNTTFFSDHFPEGAR